MQPRQPLVDIHCHLVPGIDDGAQSWAESLEMARMAVEDGITTIIATPHQLGGYAHVSGEQIRHATAELQQYFGDRRIDLTVLPGSDVRVESDLTARLASGEVLTLGDWGKHVLLELPHELYFSLDGCLDSLARASITGILSHPERNQGLLRKPEQVGKLVGRGCLMQVTAGSLLGRFGPRCQQMAEHIVRSGWAHFVATDAHGAKVRRPLMQRAFTRVAELVNQQTAEELCCRNPALVARGEPVPLEGNMPAKPKSRWFARKHAG